MALAVLKVFKRSELENDLRFLEKCEGMNVQDPLDLIKRSCLETS